MDATATTENAPDTKGREGGRERERERERERGAIIHLATKNLTEEERESRFYRSNSAGDERGGKYVTQARKKFVIRHATAILGQEKSVVRFPALLHNF